MKTAVNNVNTSEDIRRSDPARERILGLVHELDVSARQLELAHFARQAGTAPEPSGCIHAPVSAATRRHASVTALERPERSRCHASPPVTVVGDPMRESISRG